MESDAYRTGVVTREDLARVGQLPSLDRLEKGPVVLIECPQPIPCDPCAKVCPRNAISKELCSPPKPDFDKCTGCARCVTACPGLAIFIVDASLPGNKARVMMPYELIPVPRKGNLVTVTDRRGRKLGKALVVASTQVRGATLLTVEVDKEVVLDVKSISLDENTLSKGITSH